MNKIVFILLFSLSIFADDKYITAEGRFWAEESDSSQFIKNQLIHAAFINVITKDLENMGLDQEQFWLKYNEIFEESFKNAQEDLKKKMKIEKDSSDATKKEYDKALRNLKLSKKKNFLNIENAIQGFAIKNMSKSPTSPQSRFLTLEAKVNRTELSKIYNKIIRENKSVKYEKLFVIVEFDLRNLTWTDIGAESEKHFTHDILKHWSKWFQENKPANIEEVVIVENDKKDDLKEHLTLPPEDIANHASSSMKNSLLLMSNIVFKKTSDELNPTSFKIDYSGGQVLFDLASNRSVLQLDMSNKVKNYSIADAKVLSTAVANYVYRLPIDNFGEITKVMGTMQLTKNLKMLSVSKFKNLSQVLYFTNYLEEFGARLKLKAKLVNFDQEKSELVVFYQGDDTILMNFLNDLKVKSASSKVPFEFYDPAQPFQIKLLPKVDNAPVEEDKTQDQQTEV